MIGKGLGNQQPSQRAALENGINTVDVAPTYGKAEFRLASWVNRHRESLFVAEKTKERSRKRAWSELRRSLRRLGIKNFDLYQLHAIGDFQKLDLACGREGALEALKEAKETGLIRYIGVTGHKEMRVLAKAIEAFDFDSVLLPVNLASLVDLKPQNDFRPILKMAAERDMVVIAIKAIAKRRWKNDNMRYATWYEPFDTKENVLRAVWFTLSQEPVATYSLPCDVRLWPLVLDAATKFRKLDQNEQKEAIENASGLGATPLFPTETDEFLPDER